LGSIESKNPSCDWKALIFWKVKVKNAIKDIRGKKDTENSYITGDLRWLFGEDCLKLGQNWSTTELEMESVPRILLKLQ
jgi:hypothetical protein